MVGGGRLEDARAGNGRRSGPGGRRALIAVAVTMACVGATVATVTALSPPDAAEGVAAVGTATGSADPATSSGTSSAAPAARRTVGWLSGAAGDDAANGRFGSWRHTPVAIGGTWADGDAEQVEMYAICSDGAWAGWDQPLDVAVGAIDVTRGETWAAAAKGAYVTRWTKHLQQVRKCWGRRDPGKLYLRFAHEMNLATSEWRVRGGQEASFVKALTLYSSLRYKILPGAKIVLCPNDGTSPGMGGVDIRKLWPGRDARGRPVADVYAVDSYNAAPHVTTLAGFLTKIGAAYPNGVPLGIEQHRRFAERMGVPFAVGEWSNNGVRGKHGGGGESPVYVQQFYSWAAAHAGDVRHPAPGQLLYEIHFNLWSEFAFWPRTRQPRTAAAYRALAWGTSPA